MSVLQGRHRGERLVHEKLGLDSDPNVKILYSHISGELPEEHTRFHTTRLPFLPVATLDAEGRPWSSILAGKSGLPGFITNPRYNTLAVSASLWEGDPMLDNVASFGSSGETLVAGIGIEFSTRRRNKFAGNISKVVRSGKECSDIHMQFTVNQALGNCPKYINIRDLVPQTVRSPIVAYKRSHVVQGERLPDEIIVLINESDTVFFGTSYVASREESNRYPSHLGINQRGGRPGFIRVKPSDGRTVIIPDYSGNRFMTSLGNIEATPLASLTFVSFTTGNIVYLTGTARNLFNAEAEAIMPLQLTLTAVYVTGYTVVHDALPVRQRPGTIAQPSPYSPPIRLLAEESPQSNLFSSLDRPTALLKRVDIHSPSIATFTWESSVPLSINPGQAVIMDFTSLLGSKQYQHMAPMKPSSVNDDRIRTWTVSSATMDADTRDFSLTMRQKPGGVVTGALFSIAFKLAQMKPELLEDSRSIGLTVGIVGVSGEFVLPEPGFSPLTKFSKLSASPTPNKLLWIAGGIGVTPFLSMLKKITLLSPDTAWDIVLLLSTREPDILLSLVSFILRDNRNQGLKLVSYVFSATKIRISEIESMIVEKHTSRLDTNFFIDSEDLLQDRKIYLCGPGGFENSVLDALNVSGIDISQVSREGFEY